MSSRAPILLASSSPHLPHERRALLHRHATRAPHRINQIFLEPVLFAHAEATPGLRIRNRTRIDDFEQDDEGV
ncbi:FAD-dependent monooxygenase, partial [Variovorax paradoxus]|uniref:FAD-dependent monooxygenase n=1 Tax=Variovorax paradoxus TaxID=34073 RepID=UPI0038D0FE6B